MTDKEKQKAKKLKNKGFTNAQIATDLGLDIHKINMLNWTSIMLDSSSDNSSYGSSSGYSSSSDYGSSSSSSSSYDSGSSSSSYSSSDSGSSF